VLVECGYVKAQAPDGTEYSFVPSLGRVAELGSPEQIVQLYADLHGPKAESVSAYILAVMCEQENPFPLIGWHDVDGWHDGVMPSSERVIIAGHLMRHGIIGTAKPDGNKPVEKGQYADRFDASEYISAARVHFGLSSRDAEAISMTEFQKMLAMKFPDMNKPKRDVATKEEYDAAMSYYKERSRG
jgi:hypothetical protein